MSADRLLADYIGNLKIEVAEKQAALSNNRFTELYEVGILQGEIRGLQNAISVLERTIEEADE